MDNGRDVSFTGFDQIVLTPPAREIRQMQFSPRLPYEKKIALDALNYFGSVKIFLKFSRPFWSERNKLPIIHYNSTSRKNGGTGISDDILRIVELLLYPIIPPFVSFQTYYPSNPGHGPSLLASYTWEHEADYWLSMTDDQCVQKVASVTKQCIGSKGVHSSVWMRWRSDTGELWRTLLRQELSKNGQKTSSHMVLSYFLVSHKEILYW